MSRLEELIAEMCPDGVEYLPISNLGTLARGKHFVHADAVESGIPCIHYGKLYSYLSPDNIPWDNRLGTIGQNTSCLVRLNGV